MYSGTQQAQSLGASFPLISRFEEVLSLAPSPLQAVILTVNSQQSTVNSQQSTVNRVKMAYRSCLRKDGVRRSTFFRVLTHICQSTFWLIPKLPPLSWHFGRLRGGCRGYPKPRRRRLSGIE